MIGRIREFLRSLATGNGCEVVFPWYPEYNDSTPEMWLIRQTRGEPKNPPILKYPLALVLWTFLSTVLAVKMIRKEGQFVKEQSGLSRFTQFVQMLHLAWMKNLSPLDYRENFYYKPEIRKEAEHYLPSVRHGILLRKLNAGRPTERLDHKLQFYHTMKAVDLPVVEIVEVFYADGRREFEKSGKDLDGLLGQNFFVKPVNMYMGQNVARWDYMDADDAYSDGNGRKVPSGQFWEYLSAEAKELAGDEPEKQARLVQPLVLNHPEMAEFTRRGLNTLRFNSLCFPDGNLLILYAAVHMSYEDEVASVRSGVSADINLETGCMISAKHQDYHGQRLQYHPTTGARITGRPAPLFKESMALVERAHRIFSDNPIIGWDIAITPDGPVIMEANSNPAWAGVQFVKEEPLTRSPFGRLYLEYMRQDSQGR